MRVRTRWLGIASWSASDRISGMAMLTCALCGLVLANTPATADGFARVIDTQLGIPGTNINLPVAHWIEDGLLTWFFLTVGLDLKQEMTTGSLSSPRAAAVPMICAVGGMLMPPVLFVATVWASFGVGMSQYALPQLLQGWAIPTATDIAFSLAVLALFAKALPGSIRAFLMTLATVDDLLAIVLIAVCFSALHAWYWFVGIAVCACAWAWLVRRRRVPWLVVALVGMLAWLMMFEAGVHPTLAGVLVGLITPSRERFGEATPRAQRYRDKLQPLSNMVALPVFAIVATGVRLEGFSWASLISPQVVGIVVALVVGKPLGIMMTAWVSTHWAGLHMPQGLRVRDIMPMSCACGIGFTVSLLIASMAYDDAILSAQSRCAVLLASLVAAGLSGVLLHRQSLRYERQECHDLQSTQSESLRDIGQDEVTMIMEDGMQAVTQSLAKEGQDDRTQRDGSQPASGDGSDRT